MTTKQSITAPGEPHKGMQLLMSGKASVLADDGSILYQCGAGSVIEPASAIEEIETDCIDLRGRSLPHAAGFPSRIGEARRRRSPTSVNAIQVCRN